MHSSKRFMIGLPRAGLVLGLSFGLSGCVAAKHYDEARSVAESEILAHQKTRERLVMALEHAKGLEAELALRSQKLEKMERDLGEKSRDLDAEELAAAESKLEATVLLTEKRAAGELVDQLRSELARTGEHLGVFARDKRTLEQALVVAEKRLASIEAATRNLDEVVAMSRDLSLGLGDELLEGGTTLTTRDGVLVLSIPEPRLFATDGNVLSPDAGKIAHPVALSSIAHPSFALVVRSPDHSPAAVARSTAIGAALEAQGLMASRITLPSASPEPTAPAPVVDAAAPSRGDEALPAEPSDGLAPTDPKAEANGTAPATGAIPPAKAAPAGPIGTPGHFEIFFVPS